MEAIQLYRADGTSETILALPWNTDLFTLHPAGRWLACREKFGKREHWYSEPFFCDTETSKLGENEGWIHQWAVEWGGLYFIGRTARQLTTFIKNLSDWAAVKGKDWKVLGYIHNLGYDMEYLREFFPDEEPKFFAVKPHRILTAKWKHIEIRCSYLLTQKSLAKWGKDSKSKYKKLVGSYDYNRIITPRTPLTALDWSYQIGDVAVQSDSWHLDREHDGYDVRNVPLTSTGFVRADCRDAAASDPHWKYRLAGMQPDIEVYNALEAAFSGGYTHGNRFVQEQVITGPIGHRDFRSSYPARQIINQFPMGKFTPCDVKTAGQVATLSKTTALLLHVYLKNPELKDRGITAPYLGISKCQRYGDTKEWLDNGRIIKLQGMISCWMTEYDFLLYHRQYKGAYQIAKSYAAPKGRLPAWMRDKIMEYFENKTSLKHTDFKTYMLSKAKLNGIYGMSAQKYIRDDLEYDAGEWIEKQLEGDARAAELLKMIKKESTFLPFAWGVWTTALARYALFQCIDTGCGYEKFLYADTDSIFYLMDDETEQKFDAYNKMVCTQAVKAGGYADFEGVRYCLGEFTPEDDMPIQEFTFVHAKCYALIDKEGKENVTVAGVTKGWRSDRTKTNADELGPIGNLKPGFVFRECGGTRIVYNNTPLHWIEYQGEKIEVGASAIILDTEYKVSNWNNMDAEDKLMLELLGPGYISDSYGGYGNVK